MIKNCNFQRFKRSSKITLALLTLVGCTFIAVKYMISQRMLLRMDNDSLFTNQLNVWKGELEDSLPTNHRFHGFNNQSGSSEFIVPNIVHYIRFNETIFSFVEYICIRSTFINHNPDFIYFHTDVANFSGKYWDQMVNESELYAKIRIIPAELPADIFGQKLRGKFRLFHSSDILRIRLLMRHGGIYLDNDVFVVKNLDHYRTYEMVIAWDYNELMGSQVLIAHKDARFLTFWLNCYRQYDPTKW